MSALAFGVGALALLLHACAFRFRPCAFRVGPLTFLFGSALCGLAILHEFRRRAEWLSVATENGEVVGALTRLETAAEQRAHESLHAGNGLEVTVSPNPPAEQAVVRVVDVILLDTVPLVKLEFDLHLPGAVSR